MRRTTLTVAALLSLLVTWNLAAAQSSQSLRYSVVFSDSQDVTHFRDEQVPWEVQQKNYFGGASALATPLLDAQQGWILASSPRFSVGLAPRAKQAVCDGVERCHGSGS
jgi:hypothetical protein